MASKNYITGSLLGDKAGITPEGGIMVKLTNKTGVNSVKGTIVMVSAGTDNAFDVNGGNGAQPIGIVYDDGIADASECWVVVSGIAQVLLKAMTASTRGHWVEVSDAAGRADATAAAPPGGGVPELDIHMQEIGHCLESQGAGADVLCLCVLHFN